jgi:hypothetical protein
MHYVCALRLQAAVSAGGDECQAVMVARDVIEEAAREEGVDVEEAAQQSGGRKQDGSGTQEGEEAAVADADGAGAGGRISNRRGLLPDSHCEYLSKLYDGTVQPDLPLHFCTEPRRVL